MKTFKTLYPISSRPTFSVSSTATGCALLMLAAANVTQAQTANQPAAAAAASPPLEEVVVTGIRKGVEDAISAKKASSSIIEAVSAEDIGKLPDASIAEAVGRLPGIAAQRTNGRAQTLSIRGLGPDFTVTTLNGREQASVNDNRTVEFDQYPAELVSQVKVYKTPDAGMSYQGIAGTADIETVRPLAYGHEATAFRYQRDVGQLKAQVPGAETSGNRASAMWIDQFANNTFGLALGISYNKTPYQAQTREPWGYADAGGGNEVIGGDKDGVKSAYFARNAIMGVAEFKPNDQLHMVLDGYHSSFHELQKIRRMEYGTVWAGAALTSNTGMIGNRITSGSFTNDVPFLVVENYNNDRHAKVDAFGLNTNFDFSDAWSINNDLSYSRSTRNDLRLESTAGLGRNDASDPSFLPPKETVNFTTDPSSGVTHLTTANNYSNYDTTFLTDPGNWGGGPTRSGYLGHPTVTDELKAIRLAADRKINGSVFHNLTIGVNYAERTKSKYQFQSTLYLQGGASHVAVPDAYRDGITDTSFFGNPYGMINYDAYGLYNSGFWTTIDSRLDPNANYGDRLADYTNTWTVTEKLTTPYIKLDIDLNSKGIPLTGNIGVQAQHADQNSLIFRALPQGATNAVTGSYQNVGDKYTDVLPSLNLTYSLPHDMKLRAAAAKTVARPRMDDLAGGATYSVVADSASPYTGPSGQPVYWFFNGGGNPHLRPWKANTFDVSFEKYFENKGYVSAAIYYKSLTSYIYGRLSQIDFAGFPLPIAQPGLAYTKADANRIGFNTETVNGTGGSIHGVEITASLPLENLGSWLNGFGVLASAAFNHSKVTPNGLDITLPGLSKEVINATAYYERYGFSIRVSERYRAGFVGEVPDYTSALTLNNVKGEHVVDAQIGYDFREGSLKGLGINLSGSNLTNAPFVLYQLGANPFDIIKYEKYGAEYALAVSYKF